MVEAVPVTAEPLEEQPVEQPMEHPVVQDVEANEGLDMPKAESAVHEELYLSETPGNPDEQPKK